MTKAELFNKHGLSIERYGHGNEPDGSGRIIADYSGLRGEASYTGQSLEWRKVAIVRDPFPTEQAAIEAATRLASDPAQVRSL